METDLLPAEGPSWGAGGTNDGSWMPAASLGSETWRRLTRFSEGSWTTFPSPGQGGAGSRRNGLALEEGSSSVTAAVAVFCVWHAAGVSGAVAPVLVFRRSGSFASSHVRLFSQTSVP